MAVFEQAGYLTPNTTYVTGENLAYETDSVATPRSIMRAWLESDSHRTALFDATWRDQGVALHRPAAELSQTSNAIAPSPSRDDRFERRQPCTYAEGDDCAARELSFLSHLSRAGCSATVRLFA
jgi:hypothetical protein